MAMPAGAAKPLLRRDYSLLDDFFDKPVKILTKYVILTDVTVRERGGGGQAYYFFYFFIQKKGCLPLSKQNKAS